MTQKIKPKLVRLILVVAVCLLLIFLNPKKLFSPIRGFFLTLAYPFSKTFYVLSDKTKGSLEFLSSISELKKENSRLILENNNLASSVALLKTQEGENEMLREQLDLLPREKFELESCFVIGQDPQKLGSWILIDKGSSAGISVGMPVIVGEGILIGKVDEVYSSVAKVSLLTDSSSSVNGVDLETSSRGIIKGEYGLGIVMDMVSQTDALNVGDTIVTSGLGGNMPRGLLIGKVEEVKNSQDKLFQQALLIPRVKYSRLGAVFVIKSER